MTHAHIRRVGTLPIAALAAPVVAALANPLVAALAAGLVVGHATDARAACAWSERDGQPYIACSPNPAGLTPPPPRSTASDLIVEPENWSLGQPPLPAQPPVAGTPAPIPQALPSATPPVASFPAFTPGAAPPAPTLVNPRPFGLLTPPAARSR